MSDKMPERRKFLRNMLVGLLAASVYPSQLSAARVPPNFDIIRPRALAAGQTVGLIAPSSNFYENVSIGFAIEILESFGFKVKKGKYLYERVGYLAGTDQERAFDVNSMFADSEVDAIMCMRGGYGSARMLPYLDYELIRNNPKVIAGFSDNTALLNAIFAKTGLVTFHGPTAGKTYSPYALSELKKVLFSAEKGMIAQPPEFEPAEGQAERDHRVTVINPGVAKGHLIGGNLSLMARLIGTPYEPDYENAILFLEDIAEPPYKIDGMLTHLILSGRFGKLAGIVFGKCTRCKDDSNTLSLEQVLFDRLKPLGIPAIRGLMIGHVKENSTVPIGIQAELDTSNPGLKLMQAAVQK